MPTVTYNKSELRRLVGKKISDDQLAEVITLIKPNLEKTEGDTITIEHTADRTDLFGVEGLARSISTYLGYRKGLAKYNVGKPKIEIKVRNVPSRPYVAAAILRKVKVDKEFFDGMINLQELLNESIGRKRSKAAVGIHDLDKIRGPVTYHGASRNDTMVPLESDEEMKLVDVMENTEKGKAYGGILRSAKVLPVFSDSIGAGGVISFPPLINSARTAVTESTRNLFIEITGTDKKVVRDMMAILITNFGERFPIEGVRVRYEKKSETTPDLSESVVEISVNKVNEYLGLNLSARDVIGLLKRVGYDTFGSADKLEVIVPPFRTDILHPVDVIEDIAIAHGYNNFRPQIPDISTVGGSLDIEKTSRRASEILVGFGFQEVMSSVLSNLKDQFEKISLPATSLIEIENPSSNDYGCVRVSLVPGLLNFLAANKHYEYPQNIFESGDVVIADKLEETLARNERRIAGAICHSRSGFAEMKTVVDGLLRNLGVGYMLGGCDSGMYIPGRGADIYIDKKFVGSFGELHPQVIQNWDIGMPTAVFEIALEKI